MMMRIRISYIFLFHLGFISTVAEQSHRVCCLLKPDLNAFKVEQLRNNHYFILTSKDYLVCLESVCLLKEEECDNTCGLQ